MVQAPTASTYGILNPGAGRAHFSLERRPPAPDLAEFIERHWIVRWDLRRRPPFVQQLLPHPCVNLAFEGDQGAAGVHGIARRRASRTIEGSGWVVGTKFRPGGFASFTRVPMCELVDRALPLQEAFGVDAGAELAREVGSVSDVPGRIAAIESFLRKHKPPSDPVRELLMRIVGEMLSAAPGTRVDQLASRHGLSTRTLQRMFRRYVGVSPKWVLRRYRLHEATERIAAGECGDISTLAHDLGYSDHAHFNHDFRSLIGISPTDYAHVCSAAHD
jgi:AraC-like DNA-binding protein